MVVAKGREVTHLKEGDRALLTFVRRAVKEGQPDPTPWPVQYRGRPVRHGDRGATGVFTWADTTIADEQYVVRLPDHDVAMDVTAIVGCAVMTGCGAVIHSAKVRPGDSVAVIGAGGVGLCVLQTAANMGAHPVIAVDLSDDKLAFAKRFGASVGVNGAREDAVQRIIELTSGGADFVFDAIGLAKTTEQMLAATRPGVNGYRDGGMAVLVGVPHGPAPTINVRDMFTGKVFRALPAAPAGPTATCPCSSAGSRKAGSPRRAGDAALSPGADQRGVRGPRPRGDRGAGHRGALRRGAPIRKRPRGRPRPDAHRGAARARSAG